MRSVSVIAVVALLALGSVGLAAASRATDGPGVRAVAERVRTTCPAARDLPPDSRVAMVDGGIARGSAPGRSVVGQVRLSDGTSGPSPAPDRGTAHGTAMASIVARGAPAAQLVDIRVLGPDGSASAAALRSGIQAAIDARTDIINLSIAVPATDPAVSSAIRRAADAGAVVVLAAGNEGRDLASSPAWRSMAAEPCIVVVGATTARGRTLKTSNRGDGVVEVYAAGQRVPATGPEDEALSVSGTSPAAARVTTALLG